MHKASLFRGGFLLATFFSNPHPALRAAFPGGEGFMEELPPRKRRKGSFPET